LSSKKEGQADFDRLIKEFVDTCWINGTKGDVASHQFKKLVSEEEFVDTAKDYNRERDRVEHFCVNVVNKRETNEFGDLMNFCKMVLILSHGNSDVERGFSINRVPSEKFERISTCWS